MGPVIINDNNGVSQVKKAYESVEFSLANGQTDYDLDAQQATYKANIANAHYVQIYSSEQISVKWNATTNHSITIMADTLREFGREDLTNVYLTNASGTDSSVYLYFK